MIYLRLFWEFFKTGLFSIGGGLATIPFLYNMSERTSWFTATDVSNMLAVAESTPGPIGVNMATYTGYTAAGFFGSLCATLGLIAPGIIVILLIASLLTRFRQNRYVAGAFYGLRPASIGLICAAGVTVAIGCFFKLDTYSGFWSLIQWKAVFLADVLFIATDKLKKLHPAVFILFSALVGIVFKFANA